MNTSIPRPEYPRPQWRRDAWQNLNGEWLFEEDFSQSGEARGLAGQTLPNGKITVPFCRESVLSGLGHTDFCNCVWYRRTVQLPKEWLDPQKRVLLHIGACDYKTTLWVNGTAFPAHEGGYVAFSYDITDALCAGENTLIIRAEDDVRSGYQPSGKQSMQYASFGCFYTRTTGIWQTVWLESVPAAYLSFARYFANIDDQSVTVEVHTQGAEGKTVTARAYYEGRCVGEGSAVSYGDVCKLHLSLSELHLWEVGCGRLYDLVLTLENDRVDSYFGMRKIECRDGILYLNGKPVFQRLVLDQGFYPDGIYTASDLSELQADVDRSLAMGFNGARLHQKVFEPLFLSYCDQKGYIVWGEHANWGMNAHPATAMQAFLPEWQEIMRRDFNHPAIIGWCPINESNPGQNRAFMRILSVMTKSYDPTRLYIDASGWVHQKDALTDLYDLHDYEQDPAVFAATLEPLKNREPIDLHRIFGTQSPFFACPTFVSEYGGIRWASAEDAGWGYGNAPKTAEEFMQRFKELTEVLLNHPRIGALCYTQLTDVEQEVNGLYTYDRHPKFDPAFFHAILTQKAAVEQAAE